jgi:phosphopantetheine adenylyltransferase
MALFAASDTLTAPAKSIAIAPIAARGINRIVTFMIQFASAPTNSLVIQGANTDTDAAYQTLYTSTNKQLDNYTDTVAWTYYRAYLVSQSAGGVLTVLAQVQ